MTSAYSYGDPWHYAKRQALSIGLGTAGMLFFMNVHYNTLKKWVFPLLLLSFALLFAVAIIGTGPNGVRSWFSFGPFAFQPTELAKLAVVLYLASIISRKKEKFRDFQKGLLPALLVVGFMAAIIMLQPDLGSCAILLFGALIVITVGGANLKHLFGLGAVAISLAVFAIGLFLIKHPDFESYRLERFTSYMNPWNDPTGSGYHLIQSLYAFGHGGFWGAGFGKSIQKLHYLPEAHNDFIFAIIAEELGFLGSALFVLAYLFLIWRGVIIALRCSDSFGTLVGVGIIGMISVQAAINIGGVSGAIPLTGVTLPLISYGGSSMLVTLVSIGILLGISREINLENKEKKRS
jgi:cell division protein FtsW